MLQDGEPSSSTIYMKPEDEIFEQASPQIRDVSIWSSWGLQRAPWVLQTPLEYDRCAWLALAVVESATVFIHVKKKSCLGTRLRLPRPWLVSKRHVVARPSCLVTVIVCSSNTSTSARRTLLNTFSLSREVIELGLQVPCYCRSARCS
jgi:hypothetical protein